MSRKKYFGNRRRKWNNQIAKDNAPSIHTFARRMEQWWVEGVKDGSCGMHGRNLHGLPRVYRNMYKEGKEYGEFSRMVA